ncbi:UDP-N-acetylmuramoyl-L-alanyl-D-glutamate--2,6-diaminopimelate ligase [Candidatus Shapirobacteria bacterium CG03_land_8_20_14_0_80_39_12]|uniref:UDP-N-acetylmuramoyl-L-alanyl-D-glutamate--2, 6-diaminopimelate ligase n=1 Tax=Candidatus Shapirobacteria bacterium CG03_land_8_20_14_0_80_39_12 TaxID=1974879 RepID=A0A2M7BDV7_9BACT|nr:MAG: UDP-N-acetylmuramoyl-L-alanyl-D-glutamate--2,6-diaminopimelate ligase [Candidatus Shapirobacteria bacterium CG03_land_8_20_14_0_80_39_12]
MVVIMDTRSLIPQKAVNYLKHLPLALSALLFYRFPSRRLKVIGVTGTDGKTTTVSLIYEILKEAGLAVAMVSTVSAKIGREEIDTGFHVTAPDPWLLQKLLRRMADSGVKYVVLEATSHGLDQFRFLGINFEIGVLTNITREHLDYHKTLESYRQAKLKLLKRAKIAVLNKDDSSFELIRSKLGNEIITYSLKNEADFTPKKFVFRTQLLGEYNQANCLAAIATASKLGVNEAVIKKAVAAFPGVKGRMEEIKAGQIFKVVVDFAHTPNGLKQALTALKEQLLKGSRLITVFGAAGLRDRGKRLMMGAVAGRIADLVILTAEDPRTEKAGEICEEIAAGCRRAGAEPKIIPDREMAIRYALKEAKKDDIVVICGKGHEQSMCFGATEYPWSDQETVKKILKEEEP